jgi:hypothetical protein
LFDDLDEYLKCILDVPAISKKLVELKLLCSEVVQLARGQIKQSSSTAEAEGSERLCTQIANLNNWMECVAEQFVSANTDMKDVGFSSNHKKFFTEVTV